MLLLPLLVSMAAGAVITLSSAAVEMAGSKAVLSSCLHAEQHKDELLRFDVAFLNLRVAVVATCRFGTSTAQVVAYCSTVPSYMLGVRAEPRIRFRNGRMHYRALLQAAAETMTCQGCACCCVQFELGTCV